MIAISEIFGPTIQGEGAGIGVPTIFVRTGGCDFLCDWCDTMHAVDRKLKHTWPLTSASDVMAKVQQLSHFQPMLITLSGGNPALQPLESLLDLGHQLGYRFAMETQGSVAQPWFAKLDVLTLSPKAPSSKMRFDAKRFQACLDAAHAEHTQIGLKIVVSDERDLDWAGEMRAQYPQLAMVLQPCNHQIKGEVSLEQLSERMRWLTEQVMARGWYEVRVLPQLHVYLWGNQQGV